MDTLRFNNIVFLMFSAFQLHLDQGEDKVSFDGIVRHLYDIDSAALNNKGLNELLKPVLEDGKRKSLFKWIDKSSMLLIIHGHADVAAGASQRAAIEGCLDALLRPQQQQGRLKFRGLEDHLRATTPDEATRGIKRLRSR
eukprot:CAMPEP_0198575874 /NCGR_PEP_ID=MMETSP1462-20131121/116784_1 /TAXON_ID=1333877 /ORGANISM="Brandtodinium nutriculum, Strain RCC3387" /LENGTH=139 /DNA_ID=CAMNT_0044307123 /DNA_START=45 /DNA_END=461 /DNA_ORIENTATION=-